MFKKRIVLFIFIILVISVIFISSVRKNYDVPCIPASNGIAFVSNEDFSNNAYVLSGNWKMYDGLYTPEQLKGLEYSYTNDIRYMHKLSSNTYSLDIKLNTDYNDLYIMMPEPNGCRLWIDENEVHNDANNTISDNTFILTDKNDGEKTFHIVFQVNSYGGTRWNYQGLILGKASQLRKVQENFLFQSVISIGILLMLVIHSITLYAQKRSEHYLLLLGIVAFTGMISAVNNEPYIRSIFPMTSIGITDRIRPVLTEYLAILRIILRILVIRQLYSKILPKYLNKVLLVVVLFLVLFTIFFIASLLSSSDLGFVEFYLTSFIWILMFIETYLVIYNFFKGSDGSVVLCIGLLQYLAVRFVFGIMYANIIPHRVFFLPPTQSLRSAQMIHIIAIDIAISGKFAKKFSEAEDLNENLDKRVTEKTMEIEESKNQILKIQEREKELITGITHNLNSALFTLGGYVEILNEEKENLTQSGQKYLNLTVSKVDYVQKMASDIFLMAKLDDGRIQMENNSFDIIEICQQIIAGATQNAKTKNIKILFDFPNNPLFISGDDFYIQQALDNILSNAIRHSPIGSEIKLNIVNKLDTINIIISDNGDGISQNDLDFIFDRYFTKSKYGGKGTGLGLPVALEIVRQHGGDISVQSTVGKGSDFTLTLPFNNNTEI